jgi:putative NADPH-quinone reductase
MKTLIVVVHPNLEQSIINKRWIEELKKYPEKYEIYDLHNEYPDEKIDIGKEQKLVEGFEKIVFQFPFYWFNCPPFFKKWLDEVLTYGWAYGSKSGYKLQGKKITLAITAGINEADYTSSGKYRYTIKELTAPFEITFQYVKANYQQAFVFYGMEHNAKPERIEKSAKDYMSFLASL